MEPTARQRALAIHEIVRLICFESSEPYFPKKARFASLNALSRTSKIFTEPALDRLWWEQRSLVPLLKCMPEDAWEERTAGTGRDKITILHLRRPLKSTDLSRVFYYSSRIRELSFSRYGANKLHHELLKALDMALPVRTLMPKLMSLVWYSNKKDVSTVMRHILGPRVRSLHLEFDSTAGLAILPFIKSACPLVSTFTLSIPRDSRPFIPVVSDLVCGLENLTHLSVPSLDQAGLTHIAHLTSLETLSLDYVDDMAPPHPPDFLPGPCLTKLSTLTISCRTAKFCAGIIRVISSRELSSLTIHPMFFSWTTSAWQHLFNVIHNHLDHKALKGITIEDRNGLERPAEDVIASYRISSEALRPLLAFRELGDATFQTYPGIDADDDFLEEMAKAWRGLYCLQLCGEVLITQPPRTTLKCLIPFARHCRCLETLGIRLDVTAVPPFTQIAGKRLTHRLSYMYLGTSSLRSVWGDTEGKVAAFISELFPKLEALFTLDVDLPEPLESYRESWNRVGNLVPVFASMRSREKKLCKEEFNDDSDDEEEEESPDEDESESEVAS